jgi:hypothetical protein
MLRVRAVRDPLAHRERHLDNALLVQRARCAESPIAVVASNLPVRTLVLSRVKEHKPRKQMQSNEAGSAEHVLNEPS